MIQRVAILPEGMDCPSFEDRPAETRWARRDRIEAQEQLGGNGGYIIWGFLKATDVILDVYVA